MRRIITLSLVAIIASGCATPYQKDGYRGGFSETRLSENIFTVNFSGNGYTGTERSTDFSLLRSAEIALENGFKYFSVVDMAAAMEESSYTTPVMAQTSSVNGLLTTTYTGGQTVHTKKPKTSNTIICYKDKPKDVSMVFDAAFIKKSIKQKYGMK